MEQEKYVVRDRASVGINVGLYRFCVVKAGLPQSQKAQQVVGFEGCFEALGLDTAFASSWSAQECQLTSCSFGKGCLERAFGPMMGYEPKRTTFQTALF